MPVRRAPGAPVKRVLVFLVLVAGCRNTPDEIYAYCQRWASKYVGFGSHANPAAYREDLISSCMATKDLPYEPQQLPTGSASDWSNPAVPADEHTRTFGRDKANCIERGYVGQSTAGSNRAQVSGVGTIVGGSASGSYASTPIFNTELFVACMNAAGWEPNNPGTP